MSEQIEVYGRTDGKVQFQYGPKNFDVDWGTAFTALEIANLTAKLPKSVISKSKWPPAGGVWGSGAVAQKANLLMWLERLDDCLTTLGLNSLMINATITKKLWVDKVLPSELITFAGEGRRPVTLVAEALERMGLNRWGVVKEVTAALSKFDVEAGRGKRSVSVFITI